MVYTEKGLEFWSFPATELLQKLQTSKEGLSDFESSERLMKYEANILKFKRRSDTLTLLFYSLKAQ